MSDSALAAPDLPTRDRLILAAAELMRRHSYGTISVDGICKAAAVKKGTFYHHFPSKVELALEAFDHLWAEGRAMFEASVLAPGLDGEARLARFAADIAACHRETFAIEGKVYGCPLCNAGSEMGAQDERIRAKMQGIFDEAVGLFAQLVATLPGHRQASAHDHATTARNMMCLMMGVEYQAKVANDPAVIERDLLPGLLRLAHTSFVQPSAASTE